MEIELLEQLFTPEEARIATEMSLLPEPASKIRVRLQKRGIDFPDLEARLDAMHDNGTIARTIKKGKKHYQVLMLVIGMWEMRVNELTKEFMDGLWRYRHEAFIEEEFRTGVNQLRTIPIGTSIPAGHEIARYDDARALVRDHPGPFAVAECICKKGARLLGRSCKVTDIRETCLSFGKFAGAFIEHGGGREIGKAEVLAILERAENAGLVLQPNNSRDIACICCCCGDCCENLTALKRFPDPANYILSNYFAAVDAAKCTGCGTCAGRCPMDAISVEGKQASVDLSRCIGCGACTVGCKAGAIQLRPKKKRAVPPKTFEGLYLKILRKKIGTFKLFTTLIKMLLLGRKI